MDMTGAHEITVDCNDAAVQKNGLRLLAQLSAKMPIEKVIGILFIALDHALMTIMHAETPMPEANVASVRKMLDGLRDSVLSHEHCAYEINHVDENVVKH